MDRGRKERKALQTGKFKKGDIPGEGKHWQLSNRIGSSLVAEMKQDLL